MTQLLQRSQFDRSPCYRFPHLRKRTVATVKRLYDDRKLIVAKGLASKILDTSSGFAFENTGAKSRILGRGKVKDKLVTLFKIFLCRGSFLRWWHAFAEWVMRYFGKKKRAENSTGWPLFLCRSCSLPDFLSCQRLTFASFAHWLTPVARWPGLGQAAVDMRRVQGGRLFGNGAEDRPGVVFEGLQDHCTVFELFAQGDSMGIWLHCKNSPTTWDNSWNAWILYKLSD